MRERLRAIHGIKSFYSHGEHDTIVQTFCGRKVSLVINRPRLTREREQMSCEQCLYASRPTWMPDVQARRSWWKRELARHFE